MDKSVVDDTKISAAMQPSCAVNHNAIRTFCSPHASSRSCLPLSTLAVPSSRPSTPTRLPPRHSLHTRGCRAPASEPWLIYYNNWTRKLRVCIVRLNNANISDSDS